MPAPANPTMSPAAGLVNAGTDVEIDAVSDVTFYYTLDGSTPNQLSKEYVAGDFDNLLDKGGDNLNIKVVAYNDTDTNFQEPSAVVEFNYLALGLGAAVSSSAVAVVDRGAGQNGSTCAGIGLSGSDGASVGVSRIGGSAGTDVVYETGDGIGV